MSATKTDEQPKKVHEFDFGSDDNIELPNTEGETATGGSLIDRLVEAADEPPVEWASVEDELDAMQDLEEDPDKIKGQETLIVEIDESKKTAPETTLKKEVAKIHAAIAEQVKLEKKMKVTRTATSGSLTPAIIAEARKMAETKGLDIAKFAAKHNLANFNVAHVLEGELDEKGMLK